MTRELAVYLGEVVVQLVDLLATRPDLAEVLLRLRTITERTDAVITAAAGRLEDASRDDSPF